MANTGAGTPGTFGECQSLLCLPHSTLMRSVDEVADPRRTSVSCDALSAPSQLSHANEASSVAGRPMPTWQETQGSLGPSPKRNRLTASPGGTESSRPGLRECDAPGQTFRWL